MRIVLRERATAFCAALRSLPTSTTSALSMAMSVPPPIAKPTSAAFKAGESLMPSPTIATPFFVRPESFAFSSRHACTARSLSSGSTSA